jgi:hypothetical protein
MGIPESSQPKSCDITFLSNSLLLLSNNKYLMIPPLLSTTGALICRLVDGDKIELLLKVAKLILVQGVHADDAVCVRHCVRACAMCACA